MVAASKLRRAQERIVSARPFAQQMQRVLDSLASRVDPSMPSAAARREPQAGRPDAADRRHRATRGCAAASTPTSSRPRRSSSPSSQDARCALGLVGRKGRDFFGRRGFDGAVRADRHLPEAVVRRRADDRAAPRSSAFIVGRGRPACMLVYNEFKSVMTQRVVVEQLLPIPQRRRRGRARDAPASAASTTCTSRRRRRSSTSCCRATSRCRSIARCSNRTPRSLPRR